jgi:hypothetical protein
VPIPSSSIAQPPIISGTHIGTDLGEECVDRTGARHQASSACAESTTSKELLSNDADPRVESGQRSIAATNVSSM